MAARCDAPPRAAASRKQLWTNTYAVQLPKIADNLALGGLTLKTSSKYTSAMNQWMDFTANLNKVDHGREPRAR